MRKRLGRRGLLGVAVLALWIAGLGLLVRRELFRPHDQALAEAGMRVTPNATFYAVMRTGAQIGFASSNVDTANGTITVSDYLVADLPVAGKLHRASARSTVHLTRALRVEAFDVDVDADLSPIKATGKVMGDTLLLVTVQGQPGVAPDTQRIRLSGPVLFPTLVPMAVALGERPKRGAVYPLPVFDPLSMTAREVRVSVQAESLFVLNDSSAFDSTAARWRGVLPDTVRAWKLGAEGGGPGSFNGWVDEQGRIVRADQVLGLSLQRLPYEVAFENWKADKAARSSEVTAGEDIYESTAIRANKRLRTNLAQLTVRLSGVDLFGFDVRGYRQRLRGDTLIVSREQPIAFNAQYALPKGAQGTIMAVFLGGEPLLETGHPEIALLASRLRGTTTDPNVVAQRINQWVYDSVRKEIVVGVPSALATLRSRRGDCNENSQLFVALARATGIPARVAAGLVYLDGKFYYHAWPEVWLERWVAVDPTFGQYPADASHIRFTVGGLEHQADLLRLMGKLHIDVLSAN